MGKNINGRGKTSHKGGIKQDRSSHWKFGKSSGNGMYSNRIAMKKARRHKKSQETARNTRKNK